MLYCEPPDTWGVTELIKDYVKWEDRPRSHWFTSVAFLSTLSKISPKRSLENLTSGDLRSFKLCFYVSWLLNCWKNCHLTWLVYSVPQKHPLARVNLLNFGFRTVIEIWSFAIGAVKEVHIVRTKCFQVGIHCFVNSYKCKHDGKNAFVHSVIFSKSGP